MFCKICICARYGESNTFPLPFLFCVIVDLNCVYLNVHSCYMQYNQRLEKLVSNRLCQQSRNNASNQKMRIHSYGIERMVIQSVWSHLFHILLFICTTKAGLYTGLPALFISASMVSPPPTHSEYCCALAFCMACRQQTPMAPPLVLFSKCRN